MDISQNKLEEKKEGTFEDQFEIIHKGEIKAEIEGDELKEEEESFIEDEIQMI